MKPSYIKNALRKTIVSMSSNIELFVKNPGKDFTRNRKITFRDILVSTISLESHSLNHEMRKFFFKQGVNIPSKSALIQQRDKLNDNVFRHLFLEFNGRIPFKKTFKGYHLLACDGSDLNLPPLKSDNKTRVSSNTKDVYFHQAHLNAIYDLLEQRYTDILIQPRAEYNERTAFIDFIRRNQVPGKCIFIADRGYFSVNVLAHLLSSGQFFLIRMMEEGHGAAFLKRFKPPKDNEFDIMISFEATRSNKRLYTGQPVKYYVIHKNRQFDFIPKEDKTTLYPMTFRAIKLILPNGNAEYLITNLPQETFDITALSELYFMRWGIMLISA